MTFGEVITLVIIGVLLVVFGWVLGKFGRF